MAHVKDEVKALIDQLPEEVLEELKPLLERLSAWEATAEILRDPDMMKQIRQSEEDWRQGQTVAWRDVKRRDV